MEFETTELLKVLAVDTRVKIIEILKSRGPMGSKELAGLLGITPAAVSQHLKLLKHAGLVRRERQGYWIPYSLNEEALERCGQQLAEICTCGCEGTGQWRTKELQSTDLAKLRKYEQELQHELKLVQAKIQAEEGKGS
jgi:DNA-binding transcriptional ArsR family regulator